MSTYREHMVTVAAGELTNYQLTCSCGWKCGIASTLDEFAASSALRHVQARPCRDCHAEIGNGEKHDDFCSPAPVTYDGFPLTEEMVTNWNILNDHADSVERGNGDNLT